MGPPRGPRPFPLCARLRSLLASPAGPGPAGPAGGDPRQLVSRIAEAEREGWLGEVEGLRVRLAGAEDKLAQMGRRSSGATATDLGVPRIAAAQPHPGGGNGFADTITG